MGVQQSSALHPAASSTLLLSAVKGINPQTEVIHSIGSKAALSLLPTALINPGDGVLMTTPGYPIFGTHARYYGGQVHNLALREENGLFGLDFFYKRRFK